MLNLIKNDIASIVFSRNKVFGIDFNNASLKIMQIGKKRGQDNVLGWNEKKLSSEIIESFEIVKPDVFQNILQNTIKEARGKIKGNQAIVSIPENKVFVRIITIPTMEEKEAREAVKWEAESNIPISIEEVYFDWQIIKREEEKMKVLLAASPKKIIDNYLDVLGEAGIEVVACEAESVATGRSVINLKKCGCCLLVDIGMETTSFAIYRNGYPIFTTSGSVSGKLLTDLVAKYFGISHQKAERYKISTGLGRTKKEKEEALQVFKPALKTLSQEIEKTIKFFDGTLRMEKEEIEEILLCGGGANLKGLVAYLATSLKRDVRLSNPWTNLDFGKAIPPLPKDKSQSFATVIGLAIRGYEIENES